MTLANGCPDGNTIQWQLNNPNQALYIKRQKPPREKEGTEQKGTERGRQGKEAERNKGEEEENKQKKQRSKAKSKRRAASQQEGEALILTLYFFCSVFILSLAPPKAPQAREPSPPKARRPREVSPKEDDGRSVHPLVTINIWPLGPSSCYIWPCASHNKPYKREKTRIPGDANLKSRNLLLATWRILEQIEVNLNIQMPALD
ncbi:hypothetical protein ACLB2K_026161 [Fragaria x ananassa]